MAHFYPRQDSNNCRYGRPSSYNINQLNLFVSYSSSHVYAFALSGFPSLSSVDKRRSWDQISRQERLLLARICLLLLLSRCNSVSWLLGHVLHLFLGQLHLASWVLMTLHASLLLLGLIRVVVLSVGVGWRKTSSLRVCLLLVEDLVVKLSEAISLVLTLS